MFETYLRTVNDPDQNIRFSATSALSRYPKADADVLVLLESGAITSEEFQRLTPAPDR